MNREQVFLAVLSGVVSRGPQFKRRKVGECGPLEVNYDRMIKITNNVTDAVMNRSADLDVKQDSRPTWGETQRLLIELESVQKIAEQHRITAMRLQAEVDRLKQELAAAGTRPTWHHLRECEKELQNATAGLKAVVMERDATIGEMKESNDDMKSELDDLLNANNRLQAEVDRLQGKEREAVALDEAMQTIQLERKITKELLTKIQNLKADKDALRKAVEDGAMEIERLTNTLKGVEQIARMKPEDVEMLAKYAHEGHGYESRLFRPLPQTEIKTWGNDRGTLAVDPVIDVKNDLSSAVANSTEGQRVVVEDLEATVDVDQEEWVTQDVVPSRRIFDQIRWVSDTTGEPLEDHHGEWANVEDGQLIRKYETSFFPGRLHGLIDADDRSRLEVRCRRKDLPVIEVKDAPVSSVAAAEDPEEYVLITDTEHKLRACDDYCCCDVYRSHAEDEVSYLQDPPTGGWISCSYAGWTIGNVTGNNNGLVYRCKRKDLPVTPPAAESQS